MAGLYIHIPFCIRRCLYCDFYSGTEMSQKAAYVAAACKELELRRDYLNGEPLETIYFGGGTPSQLSAEDFLYLFYVIEANYDLRFCREITLEANPDDMTKEYIGSLRNLPFNRISMGVQSFQSEDLKFLNRRHGREQALDAVFRCRKNQFHNLSVDLIYGLPGQTLKEWEGSLDEAIALDVPHVSAYHLTYEKGTALYRLKESGQVLPVDEELSEAFFSLLIDKLTDAGYEHYEISNFAKPGYHSVHNSSYWNGTKYLGIGPSAHSFDGNSRQWNVASLNDYLAGMTSGVPDIEVETLDADTKYNEYIITRLRTMWGIKLSVIADLFGEEKSLFCYEQATPYLKAGLLIQKKDNIRLSRQGIFISDRIMSDLLQVRS